jgi:hypothetical protein
MNWIKNGILNMKIGKQSNRHSRRDFICHVAADAALLGLAGSLTPLQAMAQAITSSAPPAPAKPHGPSTALKTWLPSDAPNQPIGNAKGIFPGRVVWSRDPAVARWDGQTGRWWDDGNIDQAALERMWSRSLQGLSGAPSDRSAWDKLFRHFNRTRGRGEAGWQPGESIAVKINVNNSYAGYHDRDNDIDASAQAMLALLRQLVHQAGVAEKNIVIYDASPGGNRRAIADRIYDPGHAAFPEVRWVDCQGLNGREAADWVPNAITYTSPTTQLGGDLPRCVVEATYLINFGLLKGHEIAGITLSAKNHFGSIRFPFKDHNAYLHASAHPMGEPSGLVDLMGCPHLGGKTLLYVLDGVYGTRTNVNAVGDRDRWRNLFQGEWSAMYLMSQDPVALDSVGLDFLRSEFGFTLGYSGAKAFPMGSIVNCDNYLHEAALGSNQKLGPYRPNGNPIGSLGVHEHWNNAQDKQYSRNLDAQGSGIELFPV